jgi:hypothetical protein
VEGLCGFAAGVKGGESMDAEGRIIPWLPEDQGEGVKDPVDDVLEIYRQQPSDTFQEFMEKLREPWKK